MSERNYVVQIQASSRSKKENSMSEGTEKKTFKFSSKASKEAAQKQKEKTYNTGNGIESNKRTSLRILPERSRRQIV